MAAVVVQPQSFRTKNLQLIMHFLISLILLVAFLPVCSVTASEYSVWNIQKLLRIRHAESNRAMQWSYGIFSGHTLSAVAVDLSESRQIWAGERRKDGYWRLLPDERAGEDATKYCLQAPDNAIRNGMLRMERCNDDTKAQAWSFHVEKDQYTIKNFDLEACLMIRADGSYSFQDCGEAETLFVVDEVNVEPSYKYQYEEE
jgi:hypothetical protein